MQACFRRSEASQRDIVVR